MRKIIFTLLLIGSVISGAWIAEQSTDPIHNAYPPPGQDPYPLPPPPQAEATEQPTRQPASNPEPTATPDIWPGITQTSDAINTSIAEVEARRTAYVIGTPTP